VSASRLIRCCGAARRVSARQPSSFLCVAKERNQRKATPAPLPLLRRGPLRCSEPGAGGANSLGSLRSLRSDRRAESDVERALRALAPASCASRQLQGGPTQPNSRAANSRIPNSPHAHSLRTVSRLLAVRPPKLPSSAAAWGARAARFHFWTRAAVQTERAQRTQCVPPCRPKP
jgi:hypothetical protein